MRRSSPAQYCSEQDTIAVLAGAGNRGLDVIGAGEMDTDPLALLALDRFHLMMAPWRLRNAELCSGSLAAVCADASSGLPHRADAGSPKACRHSGSWRDRALVSSTGIRSHHAATAEAEP